MKGVAHLTPRVSYRQIMPEGTSALARRRTDGDGRDGERDSLRTVAERAYELFVEGGRDRNRMLEYWARAEQERSDSHLSK